MQCNFMREQLNQIVGKGSSTKPLLRLAVMAHLLRCPSCRQERQRLTWLQHLAEDLPVPSLTPDMKARVMAEITPFPYTLRRKGWNLMKTSIITGIGVCAVSVAFLLLVPHSRDKGTAMADEMHKALAKMNTFHLKGWKREGSKKISWEIWGRRTPFFYHERRGDFETLDNGKERYLVIAPNPAGNSKGVLLKLASNPAPADMGWDFSELQGWSDANPQNVYAKTATTTTYSLKTMFVLSEKPIRTRNLYTFQKGVSLPIRYETLHTRYRREPTDLSAPDQADKEAEWTGAQLEIEYDGGIPSEVAQFPNYQRVDAVEDAKDSRVPRENAKTKNGFTVQAQPLALDSAGNVVVQVQGWLGNRSLTHYEIPFNFSARLPHISNPMTPKNARDAEREGEFIHCRDDQGRAYLRAESARLSSGKRELWLLVPREPLKPGESLPRQLTLTLLGAVSRTMTVGGSDAPYWQDLLSETFEITASVPQTTTKIVYDKPKRLPFGLGVMQPLEMNEDVTFTRAYYFNLLANQTPLSDSGAFDIRRQAIHWIEQSLEMGKRDEFRSEWTRSLLKFRQEVSEAAERAK